MASFIAHLLTDFSGSMAHDARVPPFLKQVMPERQSNREEELADDTLALNRAAETKARHEEREIARTNLETALAAERARSQEELKGQRALWAEQEGLQLAIQWAEAFAGLEKQLSECIAKILSPFLAEAHRQQTIAGLVETLRSMLSDPPSELIKISGSEDILSVIQTRLASHKDSLEFLPSETVEVTILLDDTRVETLFGSWSSHLGEALKAG